MSDNERLEAIAFFSPWLCHGPCFMMIVASLLGIVYTIDVNHARREL